ncbi:MAG: F0F1 ATP synthase subunit A [Acidobacteria bacterium]|nr:F0F1 ATP synthase subunit A [Acidobacteriota bacterium]
MQEHELWITALFNQFLAGPANAVLELFGQHAENPGKPWANFVVMEIAVVALLMIVLAVLRGRLSVDRPGKLQHIFELVVEFLRGTASEAGGHDGPKHVHLFTTLFVFILASNLIGIIPTLESPTMFPPVPLGCALLAFVYYNVEGIRKQGAGHYFAHLLGPVWWLAPLMLPIEIVSHFARLLSLTARLYANIFAGEQVTLVFLSLTYFVVPSLFMGLHVFVSLLQAYVFTLLTIGYVGGAIAEEH